MTKVNLGPPLVVILITAVFAIVSFLLETDINTLFLIFIIYWLISEGDRHYEHEEEGS